MGTKNQGASRYREAGVDIDASKELVARIGKMRATRGPPGVMANPGGFAALFDLTTLDYRQPVLVSGCDGVGTKLKLAIESGQHDGIGIDLVAMCVNDVLTLGAKPLFFLDYYACAQLDVRLAEAVIRGIHAGCEEAGCSLVGGETAEMPGLYAAGDYDLAGFCVGIVEKDQLLDGRGAQHGDTLLALASSGCHANGYALIRKLLAESPPAEDTADDTRRRAQLLTPTRIYASSILPVLPRFQIRSMAHITGGGLQENLPRSLPAGMAAHIDTDSWTMPELFQWLRRAGSIPIEEMYRTFNCGAGMVLCVSSGDAEPLLAALAAAGESAWRLGRVVERTPGAAAVQFG